MRILLIHNKYKQPGGENVVLDLEGELLSTNGHFVEQLIYDNSTIRTFYDRFISGIKAIYNPESGRKLKEKIESFHPDIIHVHNFVPLISPSIFYVASRHHVPTVLTLHNYRLICPSATLVYKGKIYERSIRSFFPLDAIIKGVYRNSIAETAAIAFMVALHNLLGTWRSKVDYFIALSNFAKEKFKTSALSIPERKLIVKPNFVPDFGMGQSNRNNEFLFVGRLVEEKGIEVLLRATKILQFNLTLIGDGPLTKLVIEAAQKNPRIHYLGFQNNTTISNCMKKCRAVIVPSIWYEGFPLTILEAFSTGTLVIASNLGVMSEIIQDGVNGLLFEAGNEAALADKIIEVESKPEWSSHLAENARLTYLTHYTPEKNYSLLIGIYKKAIAREHQEQNNGVHGPVATLSDFHLA